MNKTKEIISDSAMKIFSECGYKGTTMDDIALAAGVAKGTLYYNFNSKEEIFNFIIKKGIDNLKEEIRETRESSLSAIRKLEKISQIQLTLFYKNKDFFKVILSQLWGSEGRQESLRCIIKDYINDIKVIIDEAMEQGLIERKNSTILAHSFFGSITSLAIYDLINSEDKDLYDIIDYLIEFTLKGIGIQNI